VQLSAQLARQSEPMAVIDALDRIAQSRRLGGVPGAGRLPPKKDVPQAQCELNRALLAVCCSAPSQFESGTPT
jgi:hypothetical protein